MREAQSLLLLLLPALAQSCTTAIAKSSQGGLPNDVWVRLFGGQPSFGPEGYPGPDTGAFAANGGRPVASPADLACDFEGDCCWAQEVVHDELDYVRVGGIPDRGRAQMAFGNPGPEGETKYLALTTLGRRPPGEKAQIKSCPVRCAANNEVTIRIKQWKNRGSPILEACVRNVGEVVPGICSLFSPVGPGPDVESVAFLNAVDPGQELVIQAKGLTEDLNVILIDDIRVEYDTNCEDDGDGGGDSDDDDLDGDHGGSEPPEEETPPPSGGGGGGGGGDTAAADAVMCDQLACGDGMCGWESSGTGDAESQFAVREGDKRHGNPLTGCYPLEAAQVPEYDGPNQPDFIAANMDKNQDTIMEVRDFEAPEPRLLEFWIYRSTSGMSMQACVSETDCVDLVDPNRIQQNERQWVRKALELTPGTDYLAIKATTEDNIGCVGFTGLRLTDLDGNDVC